MGKICHIAAASGHDDLLSWSRKYWNSTSWEANKTSLIAVQDHELVHHPLVDK